MLISPLFDLIRACCLRILWKKEKKRLQDTEIQTQTAKENYYFTCIDGSSEYIDGFYGNEPCGRQQSDEQNGEDF